MLKYIISFGKNVFSMEITPLRSVDGQIDYPACLKHVKDVVGKEATVVPTS